MSFKIIDKAIHKRFFPHVFFWLFYVFFFGLIYGKYGNDYKWYFLESLCMLPFVMIATYGTIYGILPFYLKKRKLIFSVFLLVLLLFFVTLGERIFLRKLNSLPLTVDSIFGITFLYLLLETNFMIGIAFAIKIVKKWIEQQKEKLEMEKRALQTELNLLKAQLHPHFLFNTMNNLYALSLEKSSKTSEGIAKISALLRSVLYECNEIEISLQKEVNLIKNYIDLEKMRYGNRLNFQFNISGETSEKEIAPMMLFTFVENSFKHGSRNDPENPFIFIDLKISNTKTEFLIENSIPKNRVEKRNRAGGIGLQNVQKRLDILYSGKYQLEITQEKTKFKVYLGIEN
ncbi:sensor histidine kinase [Maribellus comscasis]|uniref:Sensor histidine kinase n=1 Tax=Maribellus comscasis TaxID=2681766 RepID=A0A6I6JVX6_9BACT|nr:histidine kinase [Maribellus comscasis]QGY47315.1 sensor histidine kinase [Maribellus comscasis]